MNRVFEAIRRAAQPEPTDGQLLAAYADRRDGAAFAELMRRHGPMVWGVCRRMVSNREDAEDAFQATFLVLVRKPGSVRPAERVGSWLHGVAVRAARKAVREAARRRERQVVELPEPETVAEGVWHDLIPVLDEEVGRLPEKYRLPVVLCDLEGNTRREAAERLGWPEGTVAGRLALARAMLARRLTRRGLPVSGGVLAAVLSGGSLSAAVPTALFDSTVQMTASGVYRPGAAAIAEEVIRTMSASRSAVLATILAAVTLCGGVALWAQPGERPADPVNPAPTKAKEVAVDVAWGKEVDGLQAGVGFAPGQKGVFRVGDTAKLVVYLRNVSGKEVAIEYSDAYLAENQPSVIDVAGKPVATSRLPILLGVWRLYKKTLAVGEVMELGRVERVLEPARDVATGKPTLFVGPGKYKLSYVNVPPNILATGLLDLEVVGDPPGVAWGASVKGLRIGAAVAGPARVGVTIENVGTDDAVLNLGIMLANGKKQLPTAVRLTFTDAKGKARKFERKTGPGIAGRVDPFVVPLPAGGRYTLPFALADCVDADDPAAALAPGEYRVAAEFIGEKVVQTNQDVTGLALMPYWTGTAQSGEVALTVPKPGG